MEIKDIGKPFHYLSTPSFVGKNHQNHSAVVINIRKAVGKEIITGFEGKPLIKVGCLQNREIIVRIGGYKNQRSRTRCLKKTIGTKMSEKLLKFSLSFAQWASTEFDCFQYPCTDTFQK